MVDKEGGGRLDCKGGGINAVSTTLKRKLYVLIQNLMYTKFILMIEETLHESVCKQKLILSVFVYKT